MKTRTLMALLLLMGLSKSGAAQTPVQEDIERKHSPASFIQKAYEDPRGAIMDCFEHYSLVGLGECHWDRVGMDFYQSLLADPRWPATGVRIVAVEFGNARFQDVLDRYIAGKDVPLPELRKVWRNTWQFLVWDSPIYEGFFRFVRELNQKRPPAEQLRVLVGDPPTDWENIREYKQLEPYMDRGAHFYSVVKRAILDRNEKALIIAGGSHVWNEPFEDARPLVGTLLRKHHPGRFCAFYDTNRPLPGETRTGPYALLVEGTPLAKAPFFPYAPRLARVRKVDGKDVFNPFGEADWPTLEKVTEGLISYGTKRNLLAGDAETYREPAYVEELRRRNRIMVQGGQPDRSEELEEAFAEAKHPPVR